MERKAFFIPAQELRKKSFSPLQHFPLLSCIQVGKRNTKSHTAARRERMIPMKKMNKLILMILCMSLVLCFTACAKAPAPEPVAGGWSDGESPVITEAQKAVFDKAMEKIIGVDYTPIAYLGSQVVAGRNHRFLCRAKPVGPGSPETYSVVEIYEDLENNASVTGFTVFDAETGISDTLMGSWTVPESPAVTEEVRAVFDKAAGKDDTYSPAALAATQLVAGTNYCFLCRTQDGWALVYVYADLEGGAQITDVKLPVSVE